MAKIQKTPNFLNINFNENGASMEITLPNATFKKSSLSVEELEKELRAYKLKVMRAFKDLLLEVLAARMVACEKKLMSHLATASVEFPIPGVISWKRSDGTYDHFVYASYEVMKEGYEALENDCFIETLSKRSVLDQLLKALLNMPELSHEDRNGVRFSELVSLLMEALSCACHK